MLLKDLKEGQRFEFVDKGTTILLYGANDNWFTATGVFRYNRVANGDCPVLFHESTSITLIAKAGTYQRFVTPII